MVINTQYFPWGVKGILKYYSGHLDVQDVNTFQVSRVSAVVNKETLTLATFSTDGFWTQQ